MCSLTGSLFLSRRGWVDVKYLKYPDEDVKPDDRVRHTYLHELKADDGIAEIQEAVKGLPEAKDTTE